LASFHQIGRISDSLKFAPEVNHPSQDAGLLAYCWKKNPQRRLHQTAFNFENPAFCGKNFCRGITIAYTYDDEIEQKLRHNADYLAAYPRSPKMGTIISYQRPN
jgi:hypothetical protein